MVVKGKFSF